jgi:hypothetical protein
LIERKCFGIYFGMLFPWVSDEHISGNHINHGFLDNEIVIFSELRCRSWYFFNLIFQAHLFFDNCQRWFRVTTCLISVHYSEHSYIPSMIIVIRLLHGLVCGRLWVRFVFLDLARHLLLFAPVHLRMYLGSTSRLLHPKGWCKTGWIQTCWAFCENSTVMVF